MYLGPVVSSIMRNKTGAVLVAIQIAVTLAIVINSLYIIVRLFSLVWNTFEEMDSS